VDEADAVFRALADPTRRLIIDELSERGGQTLFELCVRLIERHGLGISRQAISKHLAMLEEAGLVRTEWQGRTKLHSLDLDPLGQVNRRWLKRHTAEGEQGE
jgi:DNA-binding transcriptional ArsR family regulator